MKNLFLFGLALVTLGIVSCKKDKTSQPPAESVAKLKSRTDDYGVTNYTYDANGRLTKQEHVGGAKLTYEYQPGLVVEKNYNAAGTLTSTTNLKLDEAGYVIQETDANAPGVPEVRIYNADHQLVKSVSVNGNNTSSIDYFYSNGNCDSSRYSTNGVWGTTIKNTYYTDKINSLSYKNEGTEFWGVSSKNLLKSEQYFFQGVVAGDMSNYTYEFDAKGNVTKVTSAFGPNISISYISYY